MTVFKELLGKLDPKKAFAQIRHAKDKPVTIMAIGDSLTAGDGVARENAMPAQLERKLQSQGYRVKVVNAGKGGETTTGGLARLEEALACKPDFAIVELGINDMFGDTDSKIIRHNLRRMLEILTERNIPVLLAGINPPPHLSAGFAKDYPALYEKLAEEFHAVYYPHYLNGPDGRADLMQDDMLHPNPAGFAVIVDKLLPHVKTLMKTKLPLAPQPLPPQQKPSA